jgi:hypothetical protein
MPDAGAAGSPRDPFESIISLVSGPIAAVIRSFDQLRHGSDELFKGLENFNRTMQNLNATAERVNTLLNEFEEPARAILPKVTRTVNLADELAAKVSGPIDQVVPGLTRLAETLNSPALRSLPTDLTRFVELINDLVRKLSPLGQLAESAGGLFGLRLPGITRPAPTAPAPSASVAVRADEPVATVGPLATDLAAAEPKVKKSAAKKSAAKKSAAKSKSKSTSPAKSARTGAKRKAAPKRTSER